VILLTRLGGPVFALNPDLVERCDCTPDTVITLVDGKKYLVAESLPEIISLIRQYRATVIADAQHMAGEAPVAVPHNQPSHPARTTRSATDGGEQPTDTDAEPTNVVQLHPRER
jgi:flagellar protein FlbD